MKFSLCILLLLVLCCMPAACLAQSAAAAPAAAAQVSLPVAQLSGGMTLNEALATRRSVREFAAAPLTRQEIAQLLWSAQGVTSAKGQRTAPSAHAHYYVHLYLAQPDGFYEYLPASHSLQLLLSRDIRAALSEQDTVKHAAVVFLIAGEYARAQKDAEKLGNHLVDLEAGHAAQNLLLQATALGLGAVPVGGVDPKQVAQASSLPEAITPIYLLPAGRLKR
jgi:SagB-type dehydrogenase family enzyme